MSGEKYRLTVAGAEWFRENVSCQHACPAHTDVPRYISLIAEGCFDEAFAVNRQANVFPAILGRVCMRPCEEACRRGEIDRPVAICPLKRATADHKLGTGQDLPPALPRREQRVAIVGAGPAGLSVANDLARLGYGVVVFEALPLAGGMLNVGIPPYRLDRAVTKAAIGELERMGVEIRLNTPVGRDVTLDQLLDEYDAVFIAAGAHEPIELGIPGEGLKGVLHGVTFMRKVNLGEELSLGRRVAVIGGGNTATDCARSALRLGAEKATIVYRRTRAEMPVTAEEIEEAEVEGVEVELLASPVRILGDESGRVVGLECIRNRLGEPDASGRPRPIPIEGSEFVVEADVVLPAVGQSPDLSFLPEVFERTARDRLEVDGDTLMTNVPGVFAGGDYITGPRHVISVIADGHRVAASIHRYLQGGEREEAKGALEAADLPRDDLDDYDRIARQTMPTLPAEKRDSLYDEVELGFDWETALREAARCLQCQLNIFIDEQACILCGGCVDVCPHDCIQMIEPEAIEGDEEVRALMKAGAWEKGAAMIFDEALCIRCGLCVRRCPTGAIEMNRFRWEPAW